MTNIVLHRPQTRIISRDLPTFALRTMVFAAVFLAGAGANRVHANQGQPKAESGGQVDVYTISDDEYNAYTAAKKEPDPQKRALKLLDFLQKYPKSVFVKQIPSEDYQNIKLVEDQYAAYYAARQEPDIEKRATMLVDFLKKYPQSTLLENIHYEYMELLKGASQSKKYELLESLAAVWLKTHPNDQETYAFIAEAAMNLQKYDECGEYLEAIYKMQPSSGLAKEIFQCYQKTRNLAKQGEWAENLIKMPEFNNDYMLRYGRVMKYYDEKNLPKAAEYAQLTLKSAGLAGRPDAKTQEQLRKVRRACYEIIADDLWKKGKSEEAVSTFKQAIQVERYAEGYYKIALVLDGQKKIEEAIPYYAAAELMGGEDAPKAKSRLEALYRALHNDTLVGIDKAYNKGKELLAEP